MFDSVVMVADEISLMRTVDGFSPDLVVVDLSLPISKEVNVAKRLKDHDPELSIIILSVHDEPTVVKEVMATGAEGFVLKRTAATDLILAVRAALRGRRYVSPQLKRDGKHTG